jgi:hypothetical protein
MFSPVKTIAVVAVTAAVGSMLLIAQPVNRQGGTPGAETEVAGESTAVKGTSTCIAQGEPDFKDTPPYRVTDLVMSCTETANDSRVTGTSTVRLNIEGWDERLKAQDPANSITWWDYTLVAGDGTWSGYGYGIYDADGNAHSLTIATGSGAYEGLTYTQSFTVPVGSASSETIGVIHAGPLPPGFPVAPPPSPASE